MPIGRIIKSCLAASFSLPLVRQLAFNLASNNALIFTLHRFQNNELGIKGHDPEFLRQCLTELRRQKYNLVSIDDIVEAQLKGEVIENAVAFTVDDGYLDHAEVGGDVFIEFDCPATFFLITDFVGNVYWPEDSKVKYLLENTQSKQLNWQFGNFSINTALGDENQRYAVARRILWAAKELPIAQMQQATASLAKALGREIPVQAPEKYRPMSWDDARKLEQRGMRIGAHTCQHVTLSKEDDDSAQTEIMDSFNTVARHAKNPSKVFCYPTGRPQDFCQRDIDILKQGGFSGAVSTTTDYFKYGDSSLNSSANLFNMPRFGMPDNRMDFLQYIHYLELFKSKVRNNLVTS